MINQRCYIFAGHCSLNLAYLKELIEIAKNSDGLRVIGLKSRTDLNLAGHGMGCDYQILLQNLEILLQGGTTNDLIIPPSITAASQICQDTSVMIASEIMMPSVQLPLYEKNIPTGKFMPWNPSVNQLGWPVFEMAQYAKRNNWWLGIKNGKWDEGAAKTWSGLASYASGVENRVLIHRGFEVSADRKGDFRNLPLHEIAMEVKKNTHCKLFFDPSHSYGPKKRDDIVKGSLMAMEMKISDEEYLYDGLLIEVGTSETDSLQHITLDEFKRLRDNLRYQRRLKE